MTIVLRVEPEVACLSEEAYIKVYKICFELPELNDNT